RRCRERCHTWQLHRSPDTPRRLGQAFSPRAIRNPVFRQNSSGLSIISALLVAARSTPELRLITMFTPRRNPCFDVLPHFHHRQSISDKQRKLRIWLESRTVTAISLTCSTKRTIPSLSPPSRGKPADAAPDQQLRTTLLTGDNAGFE